MKLGMWTVPLVAVVLLSGAAAQSVVFSFSNAYPNEFDATYANCILAGHNWNNVSVLTFWNINSPSRYYYEVRRNCISGSYSTVNNTIGARFVIFTTAPTLVWKNVTIADSDVYSCSLRICSSPTTVRYGNAAPLKVIQPPSPPTWLSPNQSVIQVYENEVTRIDFACGAQLKVNESVTMCLNYVDIYGSQSSCTNSSNPGNSSVSKTVSTTFPRTAVTSYFNCYTTSLFNSIPVYTSGRTLQVNYVTDEITFSLKLLPSMKLNKLSTNNYELVINDQSSYSMAIECTANGIPEPVMSIANVTDLSTSKYTVKGATFSCQNLYVYEEPRFIIQCRALYSNSNKTISGTLLVRAASGRTVYSVPALALLLALSFFKSQM